MNEDYKLSVSYSVQFLAIESTRADRRAEPVLDRHAGYGQIVGAEA